MTSKSQKRSAPNPNSSMSTPSMYPKTPIPNAKTLKFIKINPWEWINTSKPNQIKALG
jgi:hypothetical protein